MKHWHDADCEIVPGRLDTSGALPVPLRAGGAMCFSGMIPHYTAPNTSDRDRNALQLQYRGVSTRAATPEEYGRVFAEADGTPATCLFGERACPPLHVAVTGRALSGRRYQNNRSGRT